MVRILSISILVLGVLFLLVSQPLAGDKGQATLVKVYMSPG